METILGREAALFGAEGPHLRSVESQLETDLIISDNYLLNIGRIGYDLSENHAIFTLLRAT